MPNTAQRVVLVTGASSGIGKACAEHLQRGGYRVFGTQRQVQAAPGGQGVEMVALCGRKTTTIDTPKKKEIREKMFVEKYEAKSKSYLQEVRKAAMIEYR